MRMYSADMLIEPNAYGSAAAATGCERLDSEALGETGETPNARRLISSRR